MANTSYAVLVIDMQQDFIVEGAPIECPSGKEIIPRIQKLLQRARNNSIPVIYTQEAHRAEKVDFGLELEGNEPEHCLEGTLGVEIIPELQMESGDFLVKKRRYSAFFATDLDILLRGLGVNTLAIVGVATDICVRATAQDAQQLNYRVIIPEECVAGTNPSQHEATLENIRHIFGKVLPLREVLEMIDGIT